MSTKRRNQLLNLAKASGVNPIRRVAPPRVRDEIWRLHGRQIPRWDKIWK
jgi:hypothetical protein